MEFENFVYAMSTAWQSCLARTSITAERVDTAALNRAPSPCLNPETPAHVRRQHRDAGCVRPPVLLRPRRAGRPADATDELLDFGRCHAELLCGPCHFLATVA